MFCSAIPNFFANYRKYNKIENFLYKVGKNLVSCHCKIVENLENVSSMANIFKNIILNFFVLDCYGYSSKIFQ